MTSVIIENVPQTFIKKYGKVISFEQIEDKFFETKIEYWDDEELNNLGKTSTISSNSF